MKYICSLLALSIAASACNSGGKTPVADTGAAKTEAPKSLAASPTGIYTGDFGGTPIYISINFARGKNIAGYNTHKGLRRNLHGEIVPDGSGWKIRLEEPGDHPYDGVFSVRLSEDLKTMKGTWEPLHKDSASPKKFELKKIDNNQGGFWMANEESSISFLEDGSCKLEYYPKDSISSGQIEIVRGTWLRTKDTFDVNWKANAQFGKSNSRFVIHFTNHEGEIYPDSLTGEGFTFYSMP